MKVAVVMGSDSDFPILKPAVDLLHQFNVETEVIVASAHRTPGKVRGLVSSAEERGVGAFISAAGAAAHLGGVIASNTTITVILVTNKTNTNKCYTTLPVIGVPINATPLNGMDALLSTVQMPSGIPVATMAINGAKNAAIFAIEIFAVSDMNLRKQLKEYREKMVEEVEAKAAKVAQQLQA